MKTIEINAENWTGDSEKVKLYADGERFSVFGEMFKVKKVASYEPIVNEENGDVILDAYDSYHLFQKSSYGWENTDLTGEMNSNGNCIFQNWTGEITRTSKDDIRIAAAKLLFMVY